MKLLSVLFVIVAFVLTACSSEVPSDVEAEKAAKVPSDVEAEKAAKVPSDVEAEKAAKVPSDVEAEKAALDALGGCERISQENFKRINGQANGDNEYLVAVEYTFKISPDPVNSTESLQAKELELQQKLGMAKPEWKALMEEWRSSGATTASPRLNELDKIVTVLEGTLKNIGYQPNWNFYSACPNIDGNVRRVIEQVAEEAFMARGGGNLFVSNPYILGFDVNITGSMSMVKTEKGWKRSL